MCLITVSTAATITNEMLNNRAMIESIFEYNSDGLGAMYRNKRGLRIVKVLPRDIKDALEFFRSLPTDDRMLAVHWRMKTHGTINLDNCHPYDVVEGRLAMMHNGILSTGNAADPSRSDTWHFIQDYLAEAMQQAPAVAHTKGFLDMCGEFIGNNRFVFMSDDGKVSIVNKDQGIEHGGVWFANTYAWEPSTFIPTYKKRSVYSGSWKSTAGNDWDEYYTWRYGDGDKYSRATREVSKPQMLVIGDPGFNEQTLLDAVHNCEIEIVQEYMKDRPIRTIAALLSQLRCSVTRSVQNSGGIESALTGRQREAAAAFLASDSTKLHEMATKHPHTVAEVVCWYLDWDHIDDSEDEDEHDPVGASARPTALYKGYEIYVEQNKDGTYGYVIYDEIGNEWDWMNGFTSAEMARQDAIDSLKYEEDYQTRLNAGVVVEELAEDQLDREFAEVLARQREAA